MGYLEVDGLFVLKLLSHSCCFSYMLKMCTTVVIKSDIKTSGCICVHCCAWQLLAKIDMRRFKR